MFHLCHFVLFTSSADNNDDDNDDYNERARARRLDDSNGGSRRQLADSVTTDTKLLPQQLSRGDDEEDPLERLHMKSIANESTARLADSMSRKRREAHWKRQLGDACDHFSTVLSTFQVYGELEGERQKNCQEGSEVLKFSANSNYSQVLKVISQSRQRAFAVFL